MRKATRWEPLDLSALEARLVEVKRLFEQAAALAAAQDANRVAVVSTLQRRQAEERRGNPKRRQYR